jgi:hypothetical protein
MEVDIQKVLVTRKFGHRRQIWQQRPLGGAFRFFQLADFCCEPITAIDMCPRSADATRTLDKHHSLAGTVTVISCYTSQRTGRLEPTVRPSQGD